MRLSPFFCALPSVQPGCMDLVLRRRKGFVKLALASGADIVPVLAFGENECYTRPQLRPGSLADRMQRICKHGSGPGGAAGRVPRLPQLVGMCSKHRGVLSFI